MTIRVGISSCLVGEKVRYDGGHKRDLYVKETLGQYVTWIPVCPETECGLPIPREAMRLIRTHEGIRLKTLRTDLDHTPRMEKWIRKKLGQLEKLSLNGFVFKTKSPSSGMRGITIYEGNRVSHHGVGLFAKAFMEKFPDIPVEDNGRLQERDRRESFITRVFVYQRWQKFLNMDTSKKELSRFHQQHKLLLMAHHPGGLASLARIIATDERTITSAHLKEYFRGMMKGLTMKTTVKKNTKVLYHILACFKKRITAEEKQAATAVIENYYHGLVSFIVPLTLLQHYQQHYFQEYLAEQHYLYPEPIELQLRNHVKVT